MTCASGRALASDRLWHLLWHLGRFGLVLANWTRPTRLGPVSKSCTRLPRRALDAGSRARGLRLRASMVGYARLGMRAGGGLLRQIACFAAWCHPSGRPRARRWQRWLAVISLLRQHFVDAEEAARKMDLRPSSRLRCCSTALWSAVRVRDEGLQLCESSACRRSDSARSVGSGLAAGAAVRHINVADCRIARSKCSAWLHVGRTNQVIGRGSS